MRNLVFLIALSLVLAHVLRAQEPLAPPLCQPAAIDGTFFFSDIPAGQQTIAINLRNTRQQPCTLHGELGPSFAVDGHGAIVKTCWLCTPDGHSDIEAIKRNNNFVLPAGASAHVAYQWSSTGDVCQKVDWANFYADWASRAVFLFEPSHWKPYFCSVMQISGYEPGPFPAAQPSPGTDAALEASVPPTPIYADEWVKVSFELKSANGSIHPSGHCSELYAIYQNGDMTRFEPILPEGYGTLVNAGTSQPNGEYISGYGDKLPAQFQGRERLCDATGNNNKTTALLPASLRAPIHVVPTPNLSSLRHVMWRAVTADTHEPVFVIADTKFNILDPDTLPPNWGAQVDGIGAGLSVDKASFDFGETISLHLHWENFAAREAVGVTECGEPAPELEVQDASHHVLSTLGTNDYDCMGHGWGPFSIERGKPKQTFISLQYGSRGYVLPGGLAQISGPGVYYLVLVWSPPTLVVKTGQTDNILEGPARLGNTYAVARSMPVRIEILPSGN